MLLRTELAGLFHKYMYKGTCKYNIRLLISLSLSPQRPFSFFLSFFVLYSSTYTVQLCP